MSTSSGGVVSGSTARYYPFGGWRTEPTAGLTDRGFTGHLHNNLGAGAKDIGLVYMAARWYSPTLGRFISADTIVPNPTNPQSLNRYSYTRNSPLNRIDPTGHRDCEFDGNCGAPVRLPKSPPPTIPGYIPEKPPFDIFPVNVSDTHKGFANTQGFGPTQIAYDHRSGTDEEWYKQAGNLHSGIDIELPEGTPLMALGNGSIICSGKDCGLANNEDGRNGYGIAISYNDCACIVYYLHLKTVEDLQTGSVTGGQLVGTSGSSASGHEHLHLEVRPYLGAATYYNPLFSLPQML